MRANYYLKEIHVMCYIIYLWSFIVLLWYFNNWSDWKPLFNLSAYANFIFNVKKKSTSYFIFLFPFIIHSFYNFTKQIRIELVSHIIQDCDSLKDLRGTSQISPNLAIDLAEESQNIGAVKYFLWWTCINHLIQT